MSQINVNSIKNKSGLGAPSFPNGATVTGVVTATTFDGNITGNVTGNQSGGSINATTGTFSGLIDGNGGADITGGSGLTASTAKISVKFSLVELSLSDSESSTNILTKKVALVLSPDVLTELIEY